MAFQAVCRIYERINKVLEVRVKRRQGKFTVNAGFSVEDCGITALSGPSGAGKTSIVNMLAGLARPDQGRITLNGRCLFDAEKGIDVPPQKRRVGYVFQEARLFPHLSVRANLCYGMRLLQPAERYVEFEQVVELLGIDNILSRRPAKLSGGEKQRVAIGRALLCSPVLLLMDEPLASLDGQRKAELMPFISRLAEKFALPILYVSHMLNEIACLADYLVMVTDGEAMEAHRLCGINNAEDLKCFMQTKCDGCHSNLQQEPFAAQERRIAG